MIVVGEKMWAGLSGRELVEYLKASGQLDVLFAQIDVGQV